MPKLRPHIRKEPRHIRASLKERAHIGRVVFKGCVVCRRPAEAHHVTQDIPGKYARKDHRYVVGLCVDHHRGDRGIHGLGSAELFEKTYGIDLLAIAAENARRFMEEEG